VILAGGLAEGDLGRDLVLALCQNVAALDPRRLANFRGFLAASASVTSFALPSPMS